MADQQNNKPTGRSKSDGIVSRDTIQKAKDVMSKAGQEATFDLLQQIEPKFFEYLINNINRDKDKLRQRGVTGKQLQLVGDIMLTYGIDGFMQHRTAMSLYDSSKLSEIYGQNYEAWEDSLIDEFIKKKKEQGSKDSDVPKQTPKISIEPEKDKRKPGDLVDDSDLG